MRTPALLAAGQQALIDDDYGSGESGDVDVVGWNDALLLALKRAKYEMLNFTRCAKRRSYC